MNQHLLNHRHSGAILLRYTRDPSKSMEEIAQQIQLRGLKILEKILKFFYYFIKTENFRPALTVRRDATKK